MRTRGFEQVELKYRSKETDFYYLPERSTKKSAGNSYHTIKKNAIIKLSKLKNFELRDYYDVRCNIGRI